MTAELVFNEWETVPAPAQGIRGSCITQETWHNIFNVIE